MELTVMRHGETNYNVKGLCSETKGTHVHLTENGRVQVDRVSQALHDHPFDVILVSELYRTQQTAVILNATRGVDIRPDPRINDRCTGFDGKPFEEFREEIDHDPLHSRPRNGESLTDVRDRVKSFLDWLSKQPYDRVLIVTHSVIMKLIIVLIENRPLATIKDIDAEPADYTHLRLETNRSF